MPIIRYKDKRFNKKSLVIIEQANEIIEEYSNQGYDLTLRQLYYQFVSRDLFANIDKNYKKLGSVINNARLAGMIDWDSIVDRTRNVKANAHWNSPAEIIEVCSRQYQIDKWADQPNRIEVWIEKDALIGVIERVCQKNDVAYFSCRGYTSQSEMWGASQRLEEYVQQGQEPVIIHLGDHDPSGIDMTRDIKDRMQMFMGGCKVERIALNYDQVQQYKPPPNPAKMTDTRVDSYIKRFGNKSWELDALEPSVLENLIQTEIDKYLDVDVWEDSVKEENKHIKKLKKVAGDM